MRPSHSEQEDAGEGYFASISDLMVGILFIFLLMLAVFAVNYAPEDKNKLEQLKAKVAALMLEVEELHKLVGLKDEQIASQRKTIVTLTQQRDDLRQILTDLSEQLKNINIALNDDQGRLEKIRGELLFDIQKGLALRNVKVDVDVAQGILRLLSEELFEVGEAKFREEGAIDAKKLIEEMNRLLPCYPNVQAGDVPCKKQPLFETVLIEGHTDTRKLSEGGNWGLSTARAWAFLRLTLDSAPHLKDLTNDNNQSLLGLAGYGETRPLPNIDGEDKRNRRIEIRFLLSSRREDLTDKIRRLNTSLATLRALVDNRP